MRVFILEDDPERIALFRDVFREPLVQLTVATTVEEAKFLWAPPYNLVCLDHDLDGRTFVDPASERCGMEFVRWLPSRIDQPRDGLGPYIFIHSLNGGAADQMSRLLYRKNYNCMLCPFGSQLLSGLAHLVNNHGA